MTTSKTVAGCDWNPPAAHVRHLNSFSHKRSTLLALGFALCFAAPLAGASLSSYFLEPRAAILALSPDAARLAYEEPPANGRAARLVIMHLDAPAPASERPLASAPGGTPDRIDFLGWTGAHRLVVGTRQGRVFSLDAEGRNERDCELAAPRSPQGEEEERPKRSHREATPPAHFLRPVALPAEEPGMAIVESDAWRDDRRQPTGLVRFATESGAVGAIESASAWGGSGSYLYDPAGRARFLLAPESHGVRAYRASAAANGWSSWRDLTAAGLKFERGPAPAFRESTLILGTAAEPDEIYAVSNAGADRFSLFRVDLKRGERVLLNFNVGELDALASDGVQRRPELARDPWSGRVLGLRLVGREPGTLWWDPALLDAQARLEEVFPGRNVAILSWDAKRTHLIAAVASDSDAGRLFLVDATKPDLPLELLRRMPRLDRDALSETESFLLRGPDGASLFGYVTVPREARGAPAPVVVILHEGVGDRPQPGYDAEAQALGKLGYATVRFSDRGSVGAGAKRAGLARTPAAAAQEAGFCLEALAGKYPIDPRRAALLGCGEGGRLAAQTQALGGRFICAIALAGVHARADELPAGRHAAAAPATLLAAGPRGFAQGFAQAGSGVEEYVTTGPFAELSASQQADVYQKVADFLADHGLAPQLPKKRWFWQ